MADMLVKLYDLPDNLDFLTDLAQKGVVIRKPFGAEKRLVVDWVRKKFWSPWASETDMAFSHWPVSCFIAVRASSSSALRKDAPSVLLEATPSALLEAASIISHKASLVGFACYDATALGFFGPVGVVKSERGKGIGKALLLACLLDMKSKGYGYAIIGDTNHFDFYAKVCGAVVIPDSDLGIWKTALI